MTRIHRGAIRAHIQRTTLERDRFPVSIGLLLLGAMFVLGCAAGALL